ncbi:hypothetical protein CONPUDRAFT_137560 [Coniophora puteana RWD-64-598 SS2]|uniref:Uncharacterized protein n=1 Tax=Coniophora puteana (strain RWD-64-598) TaxID=741705 RepID=A0A5M3MM80_CONPW|nr:uncharacterized protein CONPUDRAFT_137560 [Coniophora puteana RWD-64-598 SS2]EIW80278.1 hypothetical protein CONPUDRAFT_137560 [Coniophora puteana RWD-64-598 SS2]
MAELKTILRSADVSKGSRRAAGGATGAALQNRDGQTAFSTFLRRRGSEEAPISTPSSSGLNLRNVHQDRVAFSPDHEFSIAAVMRIEGGIVEMPTVMLSGKDNCGPTKQVTYTSSSPSRASEHNKLDEYLLSPSR